MDKVLNDCLGRDQELHMFICWKIFDGKKTMKNHRLVPHLHKNEMSAPCEI